MLPPKNEPRGYFEKIFMWMCLPIFEILTFALRNFPHLPPINILILYIKHPILLKLGAFYHHLLKIHPIYVNWVPSCDENPPSLYQNPQKSFPKGRHIYVYHVNVSNPPPPPK